MSSTYDVIVIGAGIMGCSSAFQLAQRGLKVAIVEKGNVGDGSTGKSSAIIRQHYSNELTTKMALFGLRVFQNFEERVGGESGFQRRGFVVLVDEKDREGLEANLAMQQRIGVLTEFLSVEDLNEMMPGVEMGESAAAAYESESGYADPYLTVNAFADAARRHHVEILLNTEVTDILFQGNKVYGIASTMGELHAPQVINCTGGWGARIARMAQVEAPINACRVQVALFRRPKGYETPHPVVADFVHSSYFRPETGGLTLVGLVDPLEAEAVVDPDSYSKQVDSDYVLDAGGRLVKRYPVMMQSESTGGYAAHYAITPDWHPIVDEAPHGSGHYLCAGFSGHGFKLGPAVGVMVADMLTEESDSEFDPSIFRLDRFRENDPVRGQYERSIIG